MTHILGSFETALQECRENVLTMASIARRNLAHATKGLFERNVELCNDAIADDEDVDLLDAKVDVLGLEIVMRFQPVAYDLREALSAMRMSKDLERISDQACNIARRARKILKHAEIPETILVEPVYEMADSLIGDSIKAFADGDVDLALSLKERDRELDKAHRKLTKRLTKRMEEASDDIRPLLHLIFILRHLERIGDHAVNIGRDTVFVERATHLRKGLPEELEADESNQESPAPPPAS